MRAKRPPLVEGDGDERHGTLNGYQHWKCRCDLCREARRLAHRAEYPPSGVAKIVRPYIRNRKRDDVLVQMRMTQGIAQAIIDDPNGDAA